MHSFSILIEAENLSSGPGSLRVCLNSLSRQTIPPSETDRVVLIDRGELDAVLRAGLEREHHWLTVTPVAPDTRYGAPLPALPAARRTLAAPVQRLLLLRPLVGVAAVNDWAGHSQREHAK